MEILKAGLISLEDYNSLSNILNSELAIKLAKRLAKQLKFKRDIPRREIIFTLTKTQYRITWLRKLKVPTLVDEYRVDLILTVNNRLRLIKYYSDLTDYGMSEYSLIAPFLKPTTIVDMIYK